MSEQVYKSNIGYGPRGEYFHYAVVKNGCIIGFGEEQGNYAGGIYASPDFQENRFLTEKEVLKEYLHKLC